MSGPAEQDARPGVILMERDTAVRRVLARLVDRAGCRAIVDDGSVDILTLTGAAHVVAVVAEGAAELRRRLRDVASAHPEARVVLLDGDMRHAPEGAILIEKMRAPVALCALLRQTAEG